MSRGAPVHWPVVAKWPSSKADDPEGIVCESVETDADAIATARCVGAGLYAGPFSTNDLPRLNVDIDMVWDQQREVSEGFRAGLRQVVALAAKQLQQVGR